MITKPKNCQFRKAVIDGTKYLICEFCERPILDKLPKIPLRSCKIRVSKKIKKRRRRISFPGFRSTLHRIELAANGPGTILAGYFKKLGIPADGCGGCHELLNQMNVWGVEGCRERKQKIVAIIKERAKDRGWVIHIKARIRAVTTGLAFRINPKDPIGSLFDMALKEAEKNRAKTLG